MEQIQRTEEAIEVASSGIAGGPTSSGDKLWGIRMRQWRDRQPRGLGAAAC